MQDDFGYLSSFFFVNIIKNQDGDSRAWIILFHSSTFVFICTIYPLAFIRLQQVVSG